jgi:hypothetical protein
MKRIYEFVLPKEETVKEVSQGKGDDGADITVSKDVIKSVDKKFFIRRPTRKLYDDAELFYGVKLSEGIKAGLLTRALLAKRFSNDGGILSDKEKDEFGALYNDVFDKQVELQKIALKTTEERSAEEKEKFTEISEFLSNARERIQEFESNQSSLYDQTAENRARNKTILWWVLHLGYQVDEKEKESSYFGEGTYEEKLARYDEMEENDDDWVLGTLNKFFYYVSFWYVSKTSDPDQFKELIKFAEQADLGEDDSKYEVEFEQGKEGEEGAENEIQVEETVAVAKESSAKEKKKRVKTKAKVKSEAADKEKTESEAKVEKENQDVNLT